MATNCTIIGQAWGQGSLSTYSKNPAYAGWQSTQGWAYVLKFTTPTFSGTSKSIEFGIRMKKGYGETVNLRYAICTSDANATSYMNTTEAVNDANQIVTGTTTQSGLTTDTYALKTFTVQTSALASNTTYYLILWAYDTTGVEIGAVTSDVWGDHSIVVDTEEFNENNVDQYLIKASTLTSIANAIREKTKKERALTPDEMAIEIGTLSREEFLPHADIPGYVKEEAMRIAEKVRAVQTEDSITFLAMADSHHCGEQSDTDWKDYINLGNLHATMGAKVVSYLINMDFACYLGDITFGSNTTTSELLHQQIAEFNSWLDESYKGLLQFRTVGNHDTGMYAYQAGKEELETTEYLYDVIGSYCEINNYKYDYTPYHGYNEYGYGYRDFDDKKVRVICLNTSEGDTTGSSDYECSEEQLYRFANCLYNINSGVPNPSEWSIIILGHYPLDFSSTYPASSVLKAYLDGASIKLNGVTINFNGNNSAKIIGQFHGHTHCFKYAKLNEVNPDTNTATEYDAWRIAVPNSCFYRSNHQDGTSEHGIRFGEEYTYDKSIGSANDTAFVVNVVVPSKEVIYSFCYGAGYDRVIGYGSTVYHGIKSFLSNLSISNEVGGVKDGDPFIATLTPDKYAILSSVSVTMGGVDITSEVYENCVINIPKVTGEVIIDAKAVLNLDCINQISISTDENGDIYNGVGYKGMTFIVGSSGESITSGVSTTGFIPFEHGDVIRLYNMNFIKGVGNHRLVFYDADKKYIGLAIASSPYFMDAAYQGLINDESNYTQFTLYNTYYAPSTGAAYVRICCANITGASVVTINEEIKYADVADGNYSIVNQLINATNSNNTTSVAYNAGYTANILPEDGYVIDNITIMMGGVDVTSEVYSDGTITIPVVFGDIVITATTTKKEVVMHSITNNLIYTVNSNATASVEDGSSYTTNITAQDGYELDSVIVTMGGTDITYSVYSDGAINISNVTGNIVITAVATAISSGTYTNQIPISTDTDGSIYNGVGYKSGYYISSSGGALSSRSGSYVTGFIPCKIGDVVHLQNVNFDSDASDKSYHRVAFYDSNKTYIGLFNGQSIAVPDSSVQNSDGVWTQFGIKASMGGVDYSSAAYFRLCCSGIDDTSIITINEEITIAPVPPVSTKYTNQIPISTDDSGAIFNGTGYQSGYRLSSGGGTSALSGSYVTGFIPCKVGDTIRMKNITFQYGVTTEPNSGNQRLSFYDSSKAHILQTNATGLGGVCDGVKGDDGIWTEFLVKKSMASTDCSATAYFRINAAYIGADSIITVNEEIVDITSTTLYDAGDQCTSVTGGWTNSGWTYYADPIVSSTIGNTSMTVTGSYNSTTKKSSNSIVGTINKISLDNVSKIYADLEITAIGTVYLRACSTTDTGYSDASAVVATTGTHTIELDVSSLTGDYYIVFVAAGTSGYGYYPSANITRVWAE